MDIGSETKAASSRCDFCSHIQSRQLSFSYAYSPRCLLRVCRLPQDTVSNKHDMAFSIVSWLYALRVHGPVLFRPWARYGTRAPPHHSKNYIFLKPLDLLIKKIHVNIDNIGMHINFCLFFEKSTRSTPNKIGN